MTELDEEEFAQMRERALTELKEIVIGHATTPSFMENGCIEFCKEFKDIEVFEDSDRTKIIKIKVTPSGKLCYGLCPHDAIFLRNNISVLKKLIEENSNRPNAFGIEKEKVQEIYLALQCIETYIYMLFPFIDS